MRWNDNVMQLAHWCQNGTLFKQNLRLAQVKREIRKTKSLLEASTLCVKEIFLESKWTASMKK